MKHQISWPTGYQTQLTPVVQGEFYVSTDPNVALSTVLGSCISVCLFDDVAKIGGMNHYLLAEGSGDGAGSLRYGAHAMELLINGLLRSGASRARLKAKVFGGSMMSGRFGHIGPQNSAFAFEFLANEGFPVLGQDVGGKSARRVNFHPITGLARCTTMKEQTEELVAIPAAPAARPATKQSSAIELF